MSVPPPSYSHQPPGTPPGLEQQWNPVSAPALNPFAVTSLVVSLLCLAPLGLIFGIIALLQISRRGQRGKSLAIAGISVSGAILLTAGLAVAVVDFRVWTPPARNDSGEVAKRGWTTVDTIEVGDCFTPGSGTPGRDTPPLGNANVELIPCDEAHRGEAYATFVLSGYSAFPGRDQIATVARPQCARKILDYSMDPVAFGRLQTYFFHPDQQSWNAGNRTVVCWVARPGDGALDVSVRRDASNLDPAQLDFLSAMKPLNVGAVLRPAKHPQQDLAGATAWAEKMAEAQAETIRMLKDAELPGADQPTEQFVVELEAGLPFWRQAAEASDAEVFLGHLRSVDRHNGRRHASQIRDLLDLPLSAPRPGLTLQDQARPS
ncbi:DUF4190 domain-containing protein [Streptomyces sp. PKU-MA01144]|uniref:DUF4190 domain-containing protein n=1 Tax=Streptomyces sp. PKU-MA01144 TaxID=2729138 RepID=UPI00147AC866|nr:DUF4190 domain-containing protein [Streptomyces sp. PKU-MA01144]NNJ07597.1 DUF4190 domain-containing protein [Streptomyces sp. PKU-MA01144]